MERVNDCQGLEIKEERIYLIQKWLRTIPTIIFYVCHKKGTNLSPQEVSVLARSFGSNYIDNDWINQLEASLQNGEPLTLSWKSIRELAITRLWNLSASMALSDGTEGYDLNKILQAISIFRTIAIAKNKEDVSVEKLREILNSYFIPGYFSLWDCVKNQCEDSLLNVTTLWDHLKSDNPL